MRVLAVAANPASTITRLRVVEPLQAWLAGQGGELRMRPLHDVPLSGWTGAMHSSCSAACRAATLT